MALDLNVFVDNVYQRVGRKGIDKANYAASLLPSLFQAREWGLLLHWPKAWTFLKIEADHGENKRFDRGRPAFEKLAGELGSRTRYSANLEAMDVRVARIARGDRIVIEFVVNTDDRVFCDLAQKHLQVVATRTALTAHADATSMEIVGLVKAEHKIKVDEAFVEAVRANLPAGGAEPATSPGDKEFKLEIGLMAFSGSDEDKARAHDEEQGRLRLFLRPVQPVPYYDGYVALDIGNTASTLVCLPRSADARTSAIKVLEANNETLGRVRENHESCEPVVSHVRIDSAERFSEWPDSASWTIGRMAASSIDGLVVGPKRLAASRNYEEEEPFNTRLAVRFPRRVPAELLVCRMLQRFREATWSHPEELAITYPTTYEPRELNQLCQVIYRGFRRAEWQGQSLARNDDKVRQRIGVRLDEASAAANYYLNTLILETPGGLQRFRYLYPNGLNLLLYDCGGGTTDIAIVNAQSAPGSKKLVIRVKARSGLRGFGGDDVTVAVFRVLKAKLAIEIGRLEGKKEFENAAPQGKTDKVNSNFPDTQVAGDVLEDFLRRVFPFANRIIPTTFDPVNGGDDHRTYRNYAVALWKLADAMKCKLQDGSAALGTFQVMEKTEQTSLSGRLLGPAPDAMKADALKAWNQRREKLSQVKVHRWEIDCLIRDQVEKSIDSCNKLIARALRASREEVHWVVASGNGVRYPLILESLKKRLDVQHLDDGRFIFNATDNLKHAVAKGAVLELCRRNGPNALEIEFDAVKDCLPFLAFDVVYRDPVDNHPHVLFAQHAQYRDIAEQRVPLPNVTAADSPEAAPESQARHFTLLRHWPGDDDETYWPYLRFEFDQDVQPPVYISFDMETKQFQARDSREGAEPAKVFEETDPRIYEHPIQRGDL